VAGAEDDLLGRALLHDVAAVIRFEMTSKGNKSIF
jgi:hypothetical protein